MNKHISIVPFGISGVFLLLIVSTSAFGEETPPMPKEEVAQQGVEVLTRGPIHEAFAEPLTLNSQPNPIIHQKPPVAIEELPPDQKPEGTHIQWIPGYFAWDETGNDYIWISGLWRAVPPGRHWMPGHWLSVGDDGWQWISGYWSADGQEEIEYLPQPPTSLDIGPAENAPDAESLYTPGVWVYQDRGYRWRPGFWIRAQANWFYNPARYVYTPAGYIFQDGYWDFPLERRGILFAPARFGPEAWSTRGWNYRPSFEIGYNGLLSSMFVRRDFGRYYFGDYYEPEYVKQGFTPWFDHHMGLKTPDPLYTYSRWNSRADAKWEDNLRSIHKERLAGEAIRPPVNLVKQREFIHSVNVDRKVRIGDKIIEVKDPNSYLRHVPIIAPINRIEHKDFKFQPIGQNAEEHRKAAQQINAAAMDRQKRETRIISEGVHPIKPTDAPTRVKYDQPKFAEPVRIKHVEAPMRPEVPKHVEQPIPKHEPVQPIHVNPPPRPKGK